MIVLIVFNILASFTFALFLQILEFEHIQVDRGNAIQDLRYAFGAEGNWLLRGYYIIVGILLLIYTVVTIAFAVVFC